MIIMLKFLTSVVEGYGFSRAAPGHEEGALAPEDKFLIASGEFV